MIGGRADHVTLGNGDGDFVRVSGLGLHQEVAPLNVIALGQGAGDGVELGNPSDVNLLIFTRTVVTLGDGDGDTVEATNTNKSTITLGDGDNDTVHVFL